MPDDHESSEPVALFPLPNVVLFPRVVLPLHVFEERYKAMTSDALAGDHRIAMALLRPGWEKNYHGSAGIEPVVCIGKILAHERLPDGKYNLLLQGTSRARIVRELQLYPYRLAELQPMVETPVMELDLSNQRRQLISLLSQGQFASMPLCRKFREMLSGPWPTIEIIDIIAFNLIDDVQVKQKLLCELDPVRRSDRVLAMLERVQVLQTPSPDDSAIGASLN